MKARVAMTAAISAVALTAFPAGARERERVTLTQCERSYGTIAIVDGDTQGWTAYRLSSPRELINSLAVESGCFTPHNSASGRPADFLMNVIAGDKDEVDQGMAIARNAEAFVKAFNALAAQGPGLATLVPVPQPAAPAAATVAVETAMRSTPLAEADAVRMLRAGSTLTLTGKRERLLVEVADNFGTTGRVSVEDLN